MNYTRLILAALGSLVASFGVGGLLMVLVPALLNEAHKHPSVFRPKDEMMKVMPIGMGATFIAILIAAVMFAMMHPAGASVRDGVIFGVLLGAFVVFGFVLHNYANLNIGIKLAMLQAVAYFAQWVAVGVVISLIYKPTTP